MEEEEVELLNLCTDLVALKKFEAFPAHLLGSKRPGEWVGVRELCLRVGLPVGALKTDLFTTWLPEPGGQEASVVLLFYDAESKWSMAADYNRQRLMGESVHEQGRQPASAVAGAPLPLLKET